MTFFAAYIILAVAMPGVLLIRALYRGSRTLAEEIALGLALGYAIEVIAYTAARAAGVPLLVLAWPITTYVAFSVLPGLRAHWRRAPRRRAPLWWSWSLALAFTFLLGWSAATFFRSDALTWPALAAPYPDMPFHLALIGELKHHMPPEVPWLAGSPLFYHWFVYAHMAAASWVTGVEPLVLLFRLAMLPMAAAFLVLIGMTGRRVTHSRAGGPLTVAGSILVGAPSLYRGHNPYPLAWGGLLDNLWNSPTQTFGALLFAPVVLLLIDLIRRRRTTRGHLVLLGVFLGTLAGAKAVFLPLLGAGLLALVTVGLLRRRRPPLPVLIVLGMTAAFFVLARFVLYGNERLGMSVAPLWTMGQFWIELTGTPSPSSVAGATLLYLLCWAIPLAGVLGLLGRPWPILRPETVLLLGIGAAGFGSVLLFAHLGASHFFFLWGACPYLVVTAVYGVVVLMRRARVSSAAASAAACAGMLAAYLIPIACDVRVPLGPGVAETDVYRPYVALLVVALTAAGLLVAGVGVLRSWALTTVALMAIGLPACWYAIVGNFADSGIDAISLHERMTVPEIPRGTLAAARWLRAHSDPDDVVATNAHCRWGFEQPCRTLQFWVSALAERRTLVEGWAFAPTRKPMGDSLTVDPQYMPFWDGRRLRANDRVFYAPSAASVHRLQRRYGVRWLFADERLGPDPGIADVATPLFHSGDYTVYRIEGDAHAR